MYRTMTCTQSRLTCCISNCIAHVQCAGVFLTMMMMMMMMMPMMVKSDCSSLVILIFIENMVSRSSLEGTYTVATRRIRAY